MTQAKPVSEIAEAVVQRQEQTVSEAPARAAAPAPELLDSELYFNRELSWLDFNERVVSLAEDASVPLLERVKFCAIYASNLDEFKQLEDVAQLSWATTPAELEGADLVVLPGSKHVAADLAWLGRTGLDEAVRRRARSGRRVLGICGGLQMLGERIDDPAGVDGSGGGLALLPLSTVFADTKQTERTTTRFRALPPPWTALGEVTLSGYQIRHGRTTTTAAVAEALPDGLGFVDGPVLGIYVHGLFEQPHVLEALFGVRPRRSLDQAFDELADAIEEYLDVPALLHEVRAA